VLPLPLFTLSTRSRTPLRTGASGGLRWTCPNHLSRCWVSFSSIGATPTISRITSFRTLSLLVCPQNHHNIRISATLSCCTCCLFVGQHSAPYNMSLHGVHKGPKKGCATINCYFQFHQNGNQTLLVFLSA